MEAAIRHLVRQRAGDCCEYCRLPQTAADTTFHLEHIIARQHGGTDHPSNLALACDRCNLYKGPNPTGIDPDTDTVGPLFHLRRDAWPEHFQVHRVEIVGLTSTGKATARLLDMNATHRMQLRALLQAAGEL